MSNRLRKFRQKQHLSQMGLSAKSGVNQTTISAIESGTMPSLENALKLAKALGVKAEDLLVEDKQEV